MDSFAWDDPYREFYGITHDPVGGPQDTAHDPLGYLTMGYAMACPLAICSGANYHLDRPTDIHVDIYMYMYIYKYTKRTRL